MDEVRENFHEQNLNEPRLHLPTVKFIIITKLWPHISTTILTITYFYLSTTYHSYPSSSSFQFSVRPCCRSALGLPHLLHHSSSHRTRRRFFDQTVYSGFVRPLDQSNRLDTLLASSSCFPSNIDKLTLRPQIALFCQKGGGHQETGTRRNISLRLSQQHRRNLPTAVTGPAEEVKLTGFIRTPSKGKKSPIELAFFLGYPFSSKFNAELKLWKPSNLSVFSSDCVRWVARPGIRHRFRSLLHDTRVGLRIQGPGSFSTFFFSTSPPFQCDSDDWGIIFSLRTKNFPFFGCKYDL